MSVFRDPYLLEERSPEYRHSLQDLYPDHGDFLSNQESGYGFFCPHIFKIQNQDHATLQFQIAAL